MRWILGRRLTELFYLAATVVYEIARGIERLPGGRKRTALEAVFENDFLPLFAGHMLHSLDAEGIRVSERLARAGERQSAACTTFDLQRSPR